MSVAGDGGSAETPRHRVDIDWDKREPVSDAIYTALGRALGRPPSDIDPVANYVDPDAIEAFFAGSPAERATRSLSFEYGEFVVTVDGDGYVRVD